LQSALEELQAEHQGLRLTCEELRIRAEAAEEVRSGVEDRKRRDLEALRRHNERTAALQRDKKVPPSSSHLSFLTYPHRSWRES